MANVDRQSKNSLKNSLMKLVTFGKNPRDEDAWMNARMALGELGNIAGNLLVGRAQEDVALSSSLTELDGFAENLHQSPENKDARLHFELSLGDIEYRISRLFRVSVR